MNCKYFLLILSVFNFGDCFSADAGKKTFVDYAEVVKISDNMAVVTLHNVIKIFIILNPETGKWEKSSMWVDNSQIKNQDENNVSKDDDLDDVYG